MTPKFLPGRNVGEGIRRVIASRHPPNLDFATAHIPLYPQVTKFEMAQSTDPIAIAYTPSR